jgi:hypothetical protein
MSTCHAQYSWNGSWFIDVIYTNQDGTPSPLSAFIVPASQSLTRTGVMWRLLLPETD